MKVVQFNAEIINWEKATLKSVMSNLCAWQEYNITPEENVRHKVIVDA
jgi:hypothetical protein